MISKWWKLLPVIILMMVKYKTSEESLSGENICVLWLARDLEIDTSFGAR